MPKLNKKGHQASEKTITVSIEGSDFEVANLKKSGLTIQSKILLAYNDIWNEVDVLDLGADNSDLEKFKHHVENHNYTLRDLGVKTIVKETDYRLRHEDFMRIEALYPNYSYIEIARLHKYLETEGIKTHFEGLRDFIMKIDLKGITVLEFIAQLDKQKSDIINSNTIKMKNQDLSELSEQEQIEAAREKQRSEKLTELGMTNAEGVFIGYEMEISPEMISDLPDVAWEQIIAGIEVAAAKEPVTKTAEQAFEPAETHAAIVMEEPKKKPPVSLSTIGALTPDRISDLKGLKEETDKLLEAHPVIEVTDKKTRDKIQKSIGAILTSCTALDGKEGLVANKNKYLKAVSKTIDAVIDPETERRRKRLEELRLPAKAYDDAELIKEQELQKSQLEKMKKRTDELYAVPMSFDGQLYGIGALYITPTQIEKSTDKEFAALVLQAKEIKKKQDENAAAETAKQQAAEAALMKAAEMLSGVNGKSVEENYAVITGAPIPAAAETPKTVEAAAAKIDKIMPPETTEAVKTNETNVTSAGVETATGAPSPSAQPKQPAIESLSARISKYDPKMTYKMPAPENKILNELDLMFSAQLENPAYLKCRFYLINGMLSVVQEIRNIRAAGGKVAELNEFLEIIEKSE